MKESSTTQVFWLNYITVFIAKDFESLKINELTYNSY